MSMDASHFSYSIPSPLVESESPELESESKKYALESDSSTGPVSSPTTLIFSVLNVSTLYRSFFIVI